MRKHLSHECMISEMVKHLHANYKHWMKTAETINPLKTCTKSCRQNMDTNEAAKPVQIRRTKIFGMAHWFLKHAQHRITALYNHGLDENWENAQRSDSRSCQISRTFINPIIIPLTTYNLFVCRWAQLVTLLVLSVQWTLTYAKQH
jgi:hypothetical protein